MASKMMSLLPSSACSSSSSFPRQSRPSIGVFPTIKPEKRVDRRILDPKHSNYIWIRPMESRKFPRVNASDSPDGPPSSWQQWLLGVVVAVILPAIGYKGGIFALLKGKLDEVVNTTERVAEAVASVAEEAEKIAEEVESNLPADSNIKKTLDSVEDMANKVIQDAKIAEDAIQKVKDVEEEIEKEEEKTQQKLT